MDLNFHRLLFLLISGSLLLITGTACGNGVSEALVAMALENETTSVDEATEASTASAGDSIGRPSNWEEESHGNGTEPDYEVVFPEDQVNEITITIAPEEWEAMQANMTELFGEAGTGDGRGFGGDFGRGQGQFPGPGNGDLQEGLEAPKGGFPPRGMDDVPDDFPEGIEPPADGQRPALPEGFDPGDRGDDGRVHGGGDMTPENPDWVPATIEFNGQTWTNVGVRYKGNSSLISGWGNGDLKLPLKLDFDEFEDEYPEIEDQRFYGFKQLSLANGFSDPSFLRDAATSDILQEAGLPVAETAFYQVYLDYGEGLVELGLYTVIEVVDDTVVDRYFGDDSGNIYEGEGSAATFASTSFDQIEASFEKENNRDEADWSDIETLFEVLHSEQRTADPATWRENLEAIFNVDAFLEWLAISAVIEHWDAYGNMSHNYYLYNDPDSGQLTWISWDHNMAMMAGMGGPGAGPANDAGGRGPGSQNVSLDKDEIDDSWPLIRFTLDDPVYYQRYLDFLAKTIDGPFNPDNMADHYQEMADLIAEFATADVGQESFEEAVQDLIDHAFARVEAVQLFLEESGWQ